MIIADKLKKGDEIRVISPSRSMAIVNADLVKIATSKLEELGFNVSFGKNVFENDDFNSSTVDSRIEDLHDAFADKNVKGILTVIGGFNSNQLLKYIDYDLIKKNPKILCGFSDITALNNAIYTKTGLVTYNGLHFATFGKLKEFEYELEYWKNCLLEDDSFDVIPSSTWTDDAWFRDQENREVLPNEGYWIINKGKAKGTILGGNQCTFNLLHGTEFQPTADDIVLFLEDDEEAHVSTVDRDLQSIIHQPWFENVRGIVFGRFQKNMEISKELLTQIVKTKKELDNIPVIGNADFGHTGPTITFPLGGTAEINVTDIVSIRILEH